MKKQLIMAIVIGLASVYGCSRGTESSNEPKQISEETEIIENDSQADAAMKALQYVNGERSYENHRKAYEWAQKADPATRDKVIQRLKDMDFPVD